MDISNSRDKKRYVGYLDILHKQLDPEEQENLDVKDFSQIETKRPTEILDDDVNSEDENLERQIKDALDKKDFEEAYNLASKIQSEKILHKVVSSAITLLIEEKQFTLARDFVRLIHDMNFYVDEFSRILEKEKEEENNSGATQDGVNQTPTIEEDTNKVEINKSENEFISDEDYDNFVKTGNVAGDTLVVIAERIANGEKITDRERAIYDVYGEKIEMLLKNRKEGEDKVEEKIETYKIEKIDENLANEIFEKVKINGDDFNGHTLTPETLKKEGLLPEYKITIGDTTYFFASSGYNIVGGRVGVVAYVRQGDDVMARSYYRSNSQGVWRYLPDYTMNGGKISWFGKGFGEESITLPIMVQRALSEIIKDEKSIIDVDDPELIFAGTAKKYGRKGEYYEQSEAEPRKMEGDFYNEGKKIPPENIRIEGESSPDFSNVLISWKQKSELYGEYLVEVFQSKDRSLKYMFCRDRNGRAWVGGIEDDSELTSTGLKKKWINGGDLTTPAFEYYQQSGGYGGLEIQDGGYVDMFEKYLSKSPLIQEYMKSRPVTEDGQVSEVNTSVPVVPVEIEKKIAAPDAVVSKDESQEEINQALEKARSDYASQLVAWKNSIREKKSKFRKVLQDLGVDKQLPQEEEPAELVEARRLYIEAKKQKNKNLVGVFFEVPNQEQRPLGLAVAEMNSKKEELLSSLEKENEALEKALLENLPPLEKGMMGKAFDKWRSMPRYQRIAISSSLAFTIGLAGGLGLGTAVVYGGMRASRALAGAVLSQGAGKTMDAFYGRKNDSKKESTFGSYAREINLDNFEKKEKEMMDFLEKEKNEKKRQILKKGLVMAATAGISNVGLADFPAETLPSSGTNSGDIDLKTETAINLDKPNESVLLDSKNQLDKVEALKPEVSPSPQSILETKVELSSSGFIQDMHNLKANILAEYGGEPPESLNQIMNKTPMELAKAFHFYDPETNASGLGFKGESIGLDSGGNVYYEHLDGTKQIIFDAKTGEFHNFDGEMVVKANDAIEGARELYPNGEIGSGVSSVDLSGNTENPIDVFADNRAKVNFIPEAVPDSPVLEQVQIPDEEPIVVVNEDNIKDTIPSVGVSENIDAKPDLHIPLDNGKYVDVFNSEGQKFVAYEGTRIGQEGIINNKKILVLDDKYQDGEQYQDIRNAFVKAFEKDVKADVIGPYPIAEPFEGGKIYISYNVTDDPNSVRVLLNGKEIATGTTTIVDGKGISKLKLHSELKGGWLLADNAYERAFKYVNKLIKAGKIDFKI